MKRCLAFDLGATSIRGILATISEDGVKLDEVMRFSHRPQLHDGRWRWDLSKILDELKACLRRFPDLDSAGIDTWGVDFGQVSTSPCGEKERLSETRCRFPVTYRDPSHGPALKEVLKKMSAEELYAECGNQLSEINTLVQMEARSEELLSFYEQHGGKLLLMPGLLNYFLTGRCFCEESMLSTTMLYRPGERCFSPKILERFDLPVGLFPPVVQAGERIGTTAFGLEGTEIPIIAVLGHDTAGAVLMTEAYRDSECLFLSCGTWSLLGAMLEAPMTDAAAAHLNISHELTAEGKIYAVKNLTGMYWMEKLRSSPGTEQPSFECLNRVLPGREAPFFIDTEDPELMASENLFASLRAEAEARGIAHFDAETAHLVIYHSLIRTYLSVIHDLEKLTGRHYRRIHVVGGGSKSRYLTEELARRSGREVWVGPAEASALGNLTMQLYSLEGKKDLDAARATFLSCDPPRRVMCEGDGRKQT